MLKRQDWGESENFAPGRKRPGAKQMRPGPVMIVRQEIEQRCASSRLLLNMEGIAIIGPMNRVMEDLRLKRTVQFLSESILRVRIGPFPAQSHSQP